ncbi:C39 family peptidase [Robertmurraya sp. GLU-23]
MSYKIPAIILSTTLFATALFLSNDEHAQSTTNKESTTADVQTTSSTFTEGTASTATIVEETVDVEKEQEITEILLDVPLLNQMDSPRLYNGCEVTSLAMILQYNGLDVTKNQLAEEVVRTPLQYSSGQYGNPNIGFVGNMEDGPGLGVYHGPIYDLATNYSDHVIDLTNQSFDELLKQVAQGHPVWIITTSTFSPIDEFETWETPQGEVTITYKMHSVVITGFDNESIYINNPYGEKNQQLDRESFIQAWEQMGSQAIVVL